MHNTQAQKQADNEAHTLLQSGPRNRQIELMNAARSGASLDPAKLTAQIYENMSAAHDRWTSMDRVEAAIHASDLSQLPALYGSHDRLGIFRQGLATGKALMEDSLAYGHGHFNSSTQRYTLINGSPFGLHPAMFIPTLKLQASAEQLRYWLPLAESGKIIGTYCQTEIGHGTFVRGLETTATFDPATDEFVIHSPTVSSTKYWPGGLGFSCSHAIVMAQLIVGGKDHGVHPFMVQLRSLTDYTPLVGIELGDIGLKMGYNATDNGYAVFTHVRIPRTHMMMRNSQLSRDGTYTKAPHSKLAYSTMVYTRKLICQTAAFQLAQAATIAIRYSVVREQGFMNSALSKNKEVSLMSYQSQRYRLLTSMARAFAILFASQACDAMYKDLAARQAQGDHSTLPYGHITTAALKAFATQTAADGAEDARKCCGGHGFSVLSGLPEIVSTVTPCATLEGENYVMYQQTARYLIKAAASVRARHPVDEPMRYLQMGLDDAAPPRSCSRNFSDPSIQYAVFRHRATRMIFECEQLLRDSQSRDGLSHDEAWNLHMLTLIAAAHAHIELFVLQSFMHKVDGITDPTTHRVVKNLCDLFALVAIESPMSIGSIGFMEDGHVVGAELRSIRALVNRALDELSPEAIALTDSWNFSDESLQSALGRKDGNVYETLLNWTRQLPINQDADKQGGMLKDEFTTYIKPIIRGKL
ncbi:hypothetical protein HWV62_29276 [Athelia sp. TMB]|nr:hypothetical protein HWV62_29276 [Athelia sp. TMB]